MMRRICPIKLENYLKTELRIMNTGFILDHRSELIKKASFRFYRKTDYYSRRNIVRLIKSRQLTSELEEFKPSEHPSIQPPKKDDNESLKQSITQESANTKVAKITDADKPCEVIRTPNLRLSTRKQTLQTKKVSSLQSVKVNRPRKTPPKTKQNKSFDNKDVSSLIEQSDLFEPYDLLKSLNLIKSTNLPSLNKPNDPSLNSKQLNNFDSTEVPSIEIKDSTCNFINSNIEYLDEDSYLPKYSTEKPFNEMASPIKMEDESVVVNEEQEHEHPKPGVELKRKIVPENTSIEPSMKEDNKYPKQSVLEESVNSKVHNKCDGDKCCEIIRTSNLRLSNSKPSLQSKTSTSLRSVKVNRSRKTPTKRKQSRIVNIRDMSSLFELSDSMEPFNILKHF